MRWGPIPWLLTPSISVSLTLIFFSQDRLLTPQAYVISNPKEESVGQNGGEKKANKKTKTQNGNYGSVEMKRGENKLMKINLLWGRIL